METQTPVAPPTNDTDPSTRITAADLLREGLGIIGQRAVDYDRPEGERSMELTVHMFNLLTGHKLTITEGWKFMMFLKLARIQANPLKRDNWVDLGNYAFLAGEEALNPKRS